MSSLFPEAVGRSRLSEDFRSTRRVFVPALAVLLTAISGLVLMHALVHAVPRVAFLKAWFDLGGEKTIPAWFSSSQLLLAGLCFGLAAWWHRSDRSMRLLLAVVAAGLVLLSADEAAMIHERVNLFLKRYQVLPRMADGNGIWIFAYGAIGLALVAAFRQCLVRFAHWRPAVAAIVAGGFLVVVLGAVGFEALMYYAVFTGPLQLAVEEGLEMVGGALIASGALVLAAPLIAARPEPD